MERPRARPTTAIVAALAVGLLVAFFVVPPAWYHPALLPDSVDYLAIANAWVNGSGFVDPIKWTYYLAAPVPQSALTGPPVAPVLAALPLALGGSVEVVARWHAALLGLVAAGTVLVARRMMGLTASVCAALLIALSPSAVALARVPLADIPALAILLLVLGTARGVVTSPRAAVPCALAAVLGWATRPNLGLTGVAAIAAAVWQLGPWRAVSSRALWTFVAVFFGSLGAIYVWVRTATGYPPNAGYGFMYQMTSALGATAYVYKYASPIEFVRANVGEVDARMLANLRTLGRLLFIEPTFLYVGWIAVPGIVFCAFRAGRGSLERRLCAISSVGFGLVVVITWMAFDRLRYPLPAVLCGTLCGAAMLDDVLRAACARYVALPLRGPARVTVPVLLVAFLLWLAGGFEQAAASSALVRRILSEGADPPLERRGSPALPDLCKRIAPGRVVAASDPWSVHFMCGNPAIIIPNDIARSRWRQERFVREQRVGFIVADPKDERSDWVTQSSFRLITRVGGISLFEVPAASAEASAWQQPPPLVCAGRGPDCLALVGR